MIFFSFCVCKFEGYERYSVIVHLQSVIRIEAQSSVCRDDVQFPLSKKGQNGQLCSKMVLFIVTNEHKPWKNLVCWELYKSRGPKNRGHFCEATLVSVPKLILWPFYVKIFFEITSNLYSWCIKWQMIWHVVKQPSWLLIVYFHVFYLLPQECRLHFDFFPSILYVSEG